MARLGDFSKLLANIILTKVAQILYDFWAIWESINFVEKTAVAAFWATI